MRISLKLVDNNNEFNESNLGSLLPTTSSDYFIQPKFCLICNDETNYCHYDIPSCNGCKTFFRRSIVEKRDYACRRDGKCDIAIGMRCRACRFNKCILMGMNPAAINFPDDIDIGKVIQDIQARKRFLLQEDNSSPIEYKVKPIFIENCSREIDFLLYLEFKTKLLRESSFNPTRSFVSIEDAIIKPCELRNADKYEKPPEWPLNINFILDKMKHSPPDSPYFEELKPSRRHWLVTDFVLAIETAKALPVYEQIETKDRLLLLEFVGLINAILIQTYYSYEQNSDTIKAPDGFMPIKFGPKDRPKNKLEIEIFCRSVETLRRVGINRTEYVLLQAIIYCYFAIDGLSDQARSILQKEQEKYTLTLLRYMQNQYGISAGSKKFSEVIPLVETFAYFVTRHKQFHIFMQLEAKKRNIDACKKIPHALDRILLK